MPYNINSDDPHDWVEPLPAQFNDDRQPETHHLVDTDEEFKDAHKAPWPFTADNPCEDGWELEFCRGHEE